MPLHEDRFGIAFQCFQKIPRCTGVRFPVHGVRIEKFPGVKQYRYAQFCRALHDRRLHRVLCFALVIEFYAPHFMFNNAAVDFCKRLISGGGDGSCAATASITREQAFTILRKAMPLLGKVFPDAPLSALNSFPDKDTIADYAKVPAATLVAQGVVSGSGAGKKDGHGQESGESLFQSCVLGAG